MDNSGSYVFVRITNDFKGGSSYSHVFNGRWHLMVGFAVNITTIDISSNEVSICELATFFVLHIRRSRSRIIIPSPSVSPVLDFVKSKRLFFVGILDRFFIFDGLLDISHDIIWLTATSNRFFFFFRGRNAVNLLLAGFVNASVCFVFVNTFDLFRNLLKQIKIWAFCHRHSSSGKSV